MTKERKTSQTSGDTHIEQPVASAYDSLQDEIKTLRMAVEDMEVCSRHGFTEIENLARLALAALQVPDTYNDPEVIARALESIVAMADDSNDRVGSYAEQVIEVHDDASRKRRCRAFQEAQEANTLWRAS